jgi:hypothetical protein
MAIMVKGEAWFAFNVSSFGAPAATFPRLLSPAEPTHPPPPLPAQEWTLSAASSLRSRKNKIPLLPQNVARNACDCGCAAAAAVVVVLLHVAAAPHLSLFIR